MSSPIGELIFRERTEQGLTQDQFGKRYGVTGPAVFKFEKGFVNPSFALWMAMAKDSGLEEGDTVVLYAKCRVPEDMQEHIARRGARADLLKKHGLAPERFTRHSKPKGLRSALLTSKNIPEGLRALAKDEAVWQVYQPTGREIDRLLACFGPYGDSTKGRWLEALRVLRMFAEK